MEYYFTLARDEQRGYCEAAAAEINLDAPSIEKDFWVCWVLREVFALPQTVPHLTFKGGTSLSKCWKLIERFSEDLDIVIGRDHLGFGGENEPEQASSNKQRSARLEQLREAAGEYVQDQLTRELRKRLESRLPSNVEWKLENDPADPDQQSLLFFYPSVFSRGGYLNPQVKLEFGARSDTEPSTTPTVQPYLAEAFPSGFRAPSFTVRAVAPERTFWEKAMLLHEENYSAKSFCHDGIRSAVGRIRSEPRRSESWASFFLRKKTDLWWATVSKRSGTATALSAMPRRIRHHRS